MVWTGAGEFFIVLVGTGKRPCLFIAGNVDYEIRSAVKVLTELLNSSAL